MDADKWVTEVAESYFGECVGAGELMGESEQYEWVTQTVDGAGFGDLDDTALIEMADKGLQSHGSFEISDKYTVRGALNTLAFYGLESGVNTRIRDLIGEHNLDLCDGLSDSPPFDTVAEDLDGDFSLWRRPRWAVWKYVEELGLWADFTTIHPPSAIDRLGDAIENG